MSALVLTLRGTTVLHASAVALDDFALALVGQSGRGKSTLAALLCAAGAELVTDDVLAVEPGNPFRCVGGATELRLRGGSTPIVDDLPGAPSRPTADHRVALAPMAHRAGAIELGAIVFPFPSRTRSSVEVRLIPPGEALVGLLACPRINGWRRDAEIGRDFAVLAAVADAVPAFTAVVPWGPPFASEVATEVARAVRARR